MNNNLDKQSVKVSIILPVYNAGKYFQTCLNSLIEQTLKEIEIIVVLDKPTDGSDEIAKQFAQKDNRIKIIENETNLRTGLSRNRGMVCAIGEYIGFCDHDDFCMPEMFERLYNKAINDNLDICGCNYIRKIEIENKEIKCRSSDESDKNRGITEIIRSNEDGVIYVWNHIYRAELIRKNKIIFVDTTKMISEDVIFSLQTHFFAKTAGNIDDYLYCHIWYPQSTGAGQSYFSTENTINYLEYLYFLMSEYNLLNHQYKYAYAECVARRLYTSIFYRSLKQLTFKKTLKNMYMIRQSKIVDKILLKHLFRLFCKKPTAALFLLFCKIF